jgi:hypothetical protein
MPGIGELAVGLLNDANLQEILSVIIGVAFVYLLLSLLSSVVVEWFSHKLALRAKNLEAWIRRLLSDPEGKTLARKIYDHPLIKILCTEGRSGKPSHIPPDMFVLALTDVLADGKAGKPASGDMTGQPPSAKKAKELPSDVKEFKDLVRDSDCPVPTKTALHALIHAAGESLDEARKNIAEWFDDPMKTMAASYQRQVQQYVFFVALAVCAALNLDTIMIGRVLIEQKDLQAKVATVAASFVDKVEAGETDIARTDIEELSDAIDRLATAGLPLGWSSNRSDPRGLPRGFQGWLMKIMGIFATVLAASLGAQFWFDLLRRLVGFRQKRESRSQAQAAE